MEKSIEEKFRTVIERNTYYYFDKSFEETYEGYLNLVHETLLIVKNEIETNGLKEEIFEHLLAENENGLKAILALTGFSNESLKRLITLIRVVDDPSLSKLTYKEKWCDSEDLENIREWSDNTIVRKIRTNEYFRKGLVKVFFKGATLPFLVRTLPLFELKKLSISKLQFDIPAMIDTLVRYKEKGSYSGKMFNNPENVIRDLIEKMGLSYESGDLSELITNAPNTKRTMDFIIPNKLNPLIIIESSFLVTTSSGQGDKSKTEISIKSLIHQHYPDAIFIGFVDGIGWYVRKNDLRRMVAAYEDVFTFHPEEILRFNQMLEETFLQSSG